jgi:hypothetical protein
MYISQSGRKFLSKKSKTFLSPGVRGVLKEESWSSGGEINLGIELD